MRYLDTLRERLYEWSTRRKAGKTLRSLDAALTGSDPILLVHQMGRAGSMTTVNTLRAAGLDTPIFHTHWLEPQSVQTRLGWVEHLPDSHRPLNVRVSERIAGHLAEAGLAQRNWQLVSVFREPVARNVSVFFLSIDAFVDDFHERYRAGELDNQDLLKVFLDKFPHQQPVEWFETEVGKVFGINIFDHEFAREEGYQILHSGTVDLLLLKLEQLDNCHHQAFRDFLGVDIPELKNTHVTEQDPSRPMYADFVKNTVFPQAYLDEMYSSDFASHFYTEEEIRAFRQKWSGTAA